uniref:Immunoglobulin V-set domain-containing protein n=1 Tax=Lynx canadensis TaxID=61383 RepID=A0A667IJE5_LYNCA
MGPSLLLSLLLLPASLQAGSSKECNPNTDFGINQPASLSAPEGGSTCISFSYFHCWELAKDPRLSIAVRRRDFHGEVIYNSTQRFIHKDYKNRISLDLREGQNSGTLCIWNLRKEDENRYFCQVRVETLRDGKQVWQSIPGTKLTITDGESSCPAATTPTLHGALIPQAWPKPQSSCLPLLSSSSPHPSPLPRPLPTLLFLLDLPKPGLPSLPIPLTAPSGASPHPAPPASAPSRLPRNPPFLLQAGPPILPPSPHPTLSRWT